MNPFDAEAGDLHPISKNKKIKKLCKSPLGVWPDPSYDFGRCMHSCVFFPWLLFSTIDLVVV